jgi:hypothetical protein
MKKAGTRTRFVLAASLATLSSLAVVGGLASPASARGCVSIQSIVDRGSTNDVTVKNNCSRALGARLDLAYATDSACYSISAYGTRVIPTFSIRQNIRDAYEC